NGNPLHLFSPAAVYGTSDNSPGVVGQSDTSNGVVGDSTAISFSLAGVKGTCDKCIGVLGQSTDTNGVSGLSNLGNGVQGAVIGSSPSPTKAGILAVSSGVNGGAIAGIFDGRVEIHSFLAQPGNLSVAGTLSKGAGSFKIDHPLDPENKYLY